MKTSMKSIKVLLTLMLGLTSFNCLRSQTAASATWALTANGNAVVSGDITASAVAKGGGLGSFSYNSNDGVSASGWSNDAGSLVSDEYYEYKVTPAAGKNFTLTSVSGMHSVSNGDWIVAIYYSTDGFATSAQVGTDFSINSSSGTAFLRNSLSINVYNGSTLAIRIFAWESDANNRLYRNKSIVLTGTTSNCVNASIITNPSNALQSTCLNLPASTLNVGATGSGLNYQWYTSNTNSNTSGTSVAGATSAAYAPSEATAGTYYYYCQVTASCGSASKSSVSGALTVANQAAPSPSFTAYPGSMTALNTNVIYSTQTASSYFWKIPGVSGTDYAIVSGSTASSSITLKWLIGGAKTVSVNYTNAAGCLGSIAASSVTYVPETMSAGVFIINMGSSSPTIGNSILPYGLIYDLIRNHNVPVRWVISQTKAKDGIDFSYGGTDFKGGTFVIPSESRSSAVNAKITSWVNRGVVGVTSTSALTIQYAIVLSSFPTWTINSQNADIAITYLDRAGINLAAFPSSYNLNSPTTLGACNDLFIMPHADPTWAEHYNLLAWNQQYKGSFWAACHAASAIENLVNPSNKSQQMNFLTQKDATVSLTILSNTHYANSNSLLLWENHTKDATPPYVHRLPNDPIAQYMGTTDAAQDNGSEQIYVPRQTGGVARWNAGVGLIAYDPTQANVPSLQPDLSNAAAAIVYGRGFDDPNRGWVMYEGGHNHDGTAAANIAAMRAFFNFSFFAAKDKSPVISTSGATTNRGWIENSTNNAFEVSAQSPVGATFTYQWSSNAGGTFSNPTGASTMFSAPDVEENTPAIITCSITDVCGRVSFISFSGAMLYQASLPVTFFRFDAKKTTQQKVALSWSTSSETSNKGFRVERQAESRYGKFESIGFVDSKAKAGNSQLQLNYSLTDELPLQGEISQYRLAQVDLDGKTTYSETRIIRMNESSVVEIFPNPTTGSFFLIMSNDGKKLDIQVVNQFGKVINAFKGISTSSFKMNLTASGIYYIRLSNPETGEQSIQRIVVQK